MELQLIRTYQPGGTNGELNLKICNTIELPWRDNQRNLSCIPEGRYELKKRFTQKHQLHLMVANVAGRDGIVIHPANDALKELRGCIAPVTVHTGPGKGIGSCLANESFEALWREALECDEKIYLTITANEHERNPKNAGPYA